jgi:hypothetical protein
LIAAAVASTDVKCRIAAASWDLSLLLLLLLLPALWLPNRSACFSDDKIQVSSTG